MVVDVTGECYIKANVKQKEWYPRFVISIYSSEIINMQEASVDCVDYVPEGWDEWHFDISPRYNCEYMEGIFADGDCSPYGSYTGDGWTAP